jgi:hypothetical protein
VYLFVGILCESFKPSFKILMQTGFIIINKNAGGYMHSIY